MLGAPDVKAGGNLVCCQLSAPHWTVEEQILVAAVGHIKRPVSPRTTLEPLHTPSG